MKKNTDKTNIKNWVDNDVFAVKIENVSEEYNGRYLILIKKDYPLKPKPNSLFFRAKITEEEGIPKSLEELNKLEYIRTFDYPVSWRFRFGCKDIEQKELIPDEDGNLHTYVFQVPFEEGGDISMIDYVGNFNLEDPDDEFIPECPNLYLLPNICPWLGRSFIEKLVEDYEGNNLKSFSCYDDEPSEDETEFDDIWKSLEDQLLNNPSFFENMNMTFYHEWGVGLYDSNIASDIKEDYQKLMRKSKKANQSHQEIIDSLVSSYEDIIKDYSCEPIFWMVLANEEMKRKFLTSELKDKALKAIEKDLLNLESYERYEERKQVLEDLKEKLEKYDKEE